MFTLEPVVHLKTRTVLYREALWRPLGQNHPVGPMLQAANSLGLMRTLDFAMATAVRDFVLSSPIDSRIGLNLEPMTVVENGEGILRLLGPALRGMVIEITERGDSTLLDDDAFRQFIERACSNGGLVALDDLGERMYADYARVIPAIKPAFVKADKARGGCIGSCQELRRFLHRREDRDAGRSGRRCCRRSGVRPRLLVHRKRAPGGR